MVDDRSSIKAFYYQVMTFYLACYFCDSVLDDEHGVRHFGLLKEKGTFLESVLYEVKKHLVEDILVQVLQVRYLR